MFQFPGCAVPFGGHTRHNEVRAIGIPARHAKDQAFGDGFVLAQNLFDGGRGHFAARHVDLVAGAAAMLIGAANTMVTFFSAAGGAVR